MNLKDKNTNSNNSKLKIDIIYNEIHLRQYYAFSYW